MVQKAEAEMQCFIPRTVVFLLPHISLAGCDLHREQLQYNLPNRSGRAFGVSTPHSLIILFFFISFFNSSTVLRDTSSRSAVIWKLTASMQGGEQWRWLTWNSSWEGKGQVLLTCCGGLCCTDSLVRLSLPGYAHWQCFHCERGNLWLVLCDAAWLFVPKKDIYGLEFLYSRASVVEGRKKCWGLGMKEESEKQVARGGECVQGWSRKGWDMKGVRRKCRWATVSKARLFASLRALATEMGTASTHITVLQTKSQTNLIEFKLAVPCQSRNKILWPGFSW